MELVKTDDGKPVDEHPGTVKRQLNFRDRLLLMTVVTEAAQKLGDLKSMNRLHKLSELLDFEGANDYFEAFDQDFAKKLSDWGSKFQAFVRDKVNNADPGQKPKRNADGERGESATFWIPSRLDAHLIEALKATQFHPQHAKYALELAEKFGVKVDD